MAKSYRPPRRRQELKEQVILRAGPFSGEKVWLTPEQGGTSTAPFTANGMTGRYVNGAWEARV
jgi:hypothetical protein